MTVGEESQRHHTESEQHAGEACHGSEQRGAQAKGALNVRPENLERGTVELVDKVQQGQHPDGPHAAPGNYLAQAELFPADAWKRVLRDGGLLRRPTVLLLAAARLLVQN